MILSKYATALLQLALVAVAALQTAQSDGLTWTEVWQLLGLVVGSIVTYFAPISQGMWAAILKVGGAVIGAIITAIIPFVTGGWSAEAGVIVVLAALSALAAQAGVSIRIDTVSQALASPVVANATVQAVDPVVAQVAYTRGF